MQNDILFDNIYIGHSVEDADKLAQESFLPKLEVERALAQADMPKPEEPKSPNDLKFLDDPAHYIREKLDLFLTIAKTSPVEAIKFVPEVAGGIVAVAITLLALIAGLLGLGGSSAPAAKSAAKGKAKEVKAEATATGAEKKEAKKRRA